MVRISLIIATLAAWTWCAAGCSAPSRTYAHHSAEQVWSAMVTVAQSPQDHPDVAVLENHFWASRQDGRVEVTRTLAVSPTGADAIDDKREQRWQFGLVLVTDPQRRVVLENRSYILPVQVQALADQVFTELDDVLAGLPPLGDQATDPTIPVPADKTDGLPGEPGSRSQRATNKAAETGDDGS